MVETLHGKILDFNETPGAKQHPFGQQERRVMPDRESLKVKEAFRPVSAINQSFELCHRHSFESSTGNVLFHSCFVLCRDRNDEVLRGNSPRCSRGWRDKTGSRGSLSAGTAADW